MDLMDLLFMIIDKIGFINTFFLFIWLGFFISFVGVYISYKNFTANCVIGKAVVVDYIDYSVDESPAIYVKLLDLDHSESYQTRFSGSEKKYGIGTEVEVAYLKKGNYYDIRLAEYQGKDAVILMFILQLIPLIVMVVIYFLNEGHYI